MELATGIKGKGATVNLFDDSDIEEVESEIMSLAFKDELEKKKGNEGEEEKGKGGKSRIGAVLHTAYNNDVLWMNFRVLGSLSEQISDADEEEEIGYVRCMSKRKEHEAEYSLGKVVVSKTKKGRYSVTFAEFLPFLICWTLDAGRPKATGWLGVQENKTWAELISAAKKFLVHVVTNQKKHSKSILENLSITDLNLAYFMMASWEELEEFCNKRGIEVTGPVMSDSAELRHKKFIGEARVVFEKLNKYKDHTPLEYLQAVGNCWYKKDN